MEHGLSKVMWCSRKKPLPREAMDTVTTAFRDHELNEILSGLYLTCEERVCNRRKSIEEGISLVLTLNGGENVAPYRIYEYSTESKRYVYQKLSSFNLFASLLDEYTSSDVPEDLQKRKVFIRSVTADDCPTYDICRHFPELCALIELVMVNRESNEVLPSRRHVVVVHCLMGVSRSAAVVAAYMMKWGGYSKDEALSIIRKNRPVANPNPGFQKQLEKWGNGGYYRVTDELSAYLASSEICGKSDLDNFIEKQLCLLLREKSFVEDRNKFGLVIRYAVNESSDVRRAVRKIITYINTCIVDEVYVDAPTFFNNASDVVKSIYMHVPNVPTHMKEEFGNPFSGCFFLEMLKTISVSVVGKCHWEVARTILCLLRVARVERSTSISREEHYYTSCEDESTGAFPEGMELTFPFLPFLAPYVVGVIQLGDGTTDMKGWGTLSSEQLGDDSLLPSERTLFLSEGNATMDASDVFASVYSCMTSQVGFLKSDIELRILDEVLQGSTLLTVINRYINIEKDNDVFLLWMRKIVGTVMGVRFFLDAVDGYLAQICDRSAEFRMTRSIADEKVPWTEVMTCMKLVGTVYESRCCSSVDFLSWIVQEIGVMVNQGVVVIPTDVLLMCEQR